MMVWYMLPTIGLFGYYFWCPFVYIDTEEFYSKSPRKRKYHLWNFPGAPDAVVKYQAHKILGRDIYDPGHSVCSVYRHTYQYWLGTQPMTTLDRRHETTDIEGVITERNGRSSKSD